MNKPSKEAQQLVIRFGRACSRVALVQHETDSDSRKAIFVERQNAIDALITYIADLENK